MVRVLTYNVHGCRGGDRRLDVSRVADVIAAARPDVVALQELDVGRRRSGRVDQAHALAQRLGMAFHFHAALHVEEEQYGDAVLSALPMRLVRSAPLPTLPEFRRLERRGALWVEVLTPSGARLQVVTTHLGLVPQEQMVQVNALLSEGWLANPAFKAPGVVLGDFNATERYGAYRRMTAALSDARRQSGVLRGARTFPSRLPILRIDHIFLTPGLEVASLRTLDGPLARIASDHLPLVADLKVGLG